jgi:hypothetical protein
VKQYSPFLKKKRIAVIDTTKGSTQITWECQTLRMIHVFIRSEKKFQPAFCVKIFYRDPERVQNLRADRPAPQDFFQADPSHIFEDLIRKSRRDFSAMAARTSGSALPESMSLPLIGELDGAGSHLPPTYKTIPGVPGQSRDIRSRNPRSGPCTRPDFMVFRIRLQKPLHFYTQFMKSRHTGDSRQTGHFPWRCKTLLYAFGWPISVRIDHRHG